MSKDNDYHTHEALDRISVIMYMVESTLFGYHGIQKQEWRGIKDDISANRKRILSFLEEIRS